MRSRFNTQERTIYRLTRKRDILVSFLESKGVELPTTDFATVLKACRDYFGIHRGLVCNSYGSFHAAYSTMLQRIEAERGLIAKREAIRPEFKSKQSNTAPNPLGYKRSANEQVKRFYQSHAWRQLRYQILKEHGFKCLACGRSPADGAVIQVDHIKPLRKYWHLRLEPNNLQPLCDWCNHGKGNWDETNLTKLTRDEEVVDRLSAIIEQLKPPE